MLWLLRLWWHICPRGKKKVIIQSLGEYEQASVFNGLYGKALDKCLPRIYLK